MLNKKRIYILISTVLVLIFVLSGCTSVDNTASDIEKRLKEEAADLKENITNLEENLSKVNDDFNKKISELDIKENTIEKLEEALDKLQSPPSQSASLVNTAFTVLGYFANEDSASINNIASSDRGVRFSPYFNVDENQDIVFYPNNTIPSMFTNTTVYTWGIYDGSGDDITGDFLGYYNEFVYDEDFLNPELVSINTTTGQGNIINNIEDVYPNDSYVEFHFTGFDPQYEGLDWRSLVLVFEEDNGDWYLVGVVHGSWTI